jgi:RHS repeat-associated protein
MRLSGAGGVLDSYASDSYGSIAGGNGAATGFPYGFGAQFGYYTDTETRVTLCQQRYYDPAKGRWLNRDPLGLAGGRNLYEAFGDDPGNAQDPSGLLDAGQWTTFGGYASSVGAVFEGYGDNLNPVAWADGAAQLGQIAGSRGFGTAGMSVVRGFWDGLTGTDPRRFGNSTGAILLTAAGVGARFADGISIAAQAPYEPPASAPVGRSGAPIEIEPGTNSPGAVNGREFSGHAFDRMQGRGITPTMVEETIQNGSATAGRGGTTIYRSQGRAVIVSQSGKVVTTW